MSAELACRPECPKGHGPMVLRDKPDKIAAELGTWYDCQHGKASPSGGCACSTLLPAPWLAEQHARAGRP